MKKLSVAVITFNEEENIRKLLSTVYDIADEIVITDSFSTDSTKKVCAEFPKVKFFEKKFEGYGPQKNFALSQCSCDWVFFPDADEIPDEKFLLSIKKILTAETAEFDVYDVRFNNFIGRHHIRHGGWGNVMRPRFFKKNSAKFSDDKIHETLLTDGKHGVLKGRINHYTYRNMFHYFQKMNLYSDMMARKNFDLGKKISRFKVVTGPSFTFFKTYITKAGFLDGFPGFYVAKTIAYYTFMKHMKHYTLQRKKMRGENV